ncbi:MAG: hypothetical protein KF914_05925 [Rhizobiaceae bacterium]|nr:hypothetical protein [Rhizobiaceae bacterium]
MIMQQSHAGGAGRYAAQAASSAGLVELHRTQTAIAVALELLDELLQLLPERPDAAGLKEVEDVLREIRHLAAAGLRSIRKATDLPEEPAGSGVGRG